ncbi:MAG: UDP-N-acetylglucosamine 2-epimerase (non-hydrolyzing) [Defluviitaleaceae bacterium]|nr:UDP-N-acetylglucosamine 2-epimerase (non-hydrolyzing) [Defluviitaleaceae bacterium]
MEKIRVLSIFGTRPEATKMVSPVKALEAHDAIESIVCVTAQHRELLDDVLNPLDVVPDYDLDLMRERQSLTELTARALTGLETVIKKAQPDWILVHGDTATTLAGSLAAFYNQVKVAHVEAGLRTYDKYQPFPEEINRKVTTAIADLHFAPTALAREQLLKENVSEDAIIVTGNTGIDLMAHTVKDDHAFQEPAIAALDKNKKGKRIILMTAHRRENWGQPLEHICKAARRIADAFPDVVVVYPVHPNPVVKETAHRILADHDRIILTGPVNVFDLHNLMSRAFLVLTDSGGLQEEAPTLNKPVVVMREVTERPEGEAAGTLILAGTDEDRIYETTHSLLTDETKYQRMAQVPNPFGDGMASGRIAEAIVAIGK